jgi:oxygen-dependent protoporphyrinogen oxidase
MSSVVVVGAGIAGLSCAWRLRRAGHDVEVLERSGQAGGRMRSEARDGFIIDRGAPLIRSGDRNLHAVATTLGIAERMRRVASTGDAVLRAGEFHCADLQSPAGLLLSQLLSGRAKARLVKLAVELARRWRRIEPQHPDRAADLDNENLASALTCVVGDECFENLLGPRFAARFGCEPEELSWAFALLALRSAARAGPHQTFQGGTGLLAARLAEQVPLRLGCEVDHIETETGGACIDYRRDGRPGRVVTDAVVVAVPGCEVAALCPKLTPDERGFFEQVRYARGITASLALDQAPRGLSYSRVSVSRSVGIGLAGLDIEHHKPGFAPPGAGLIRATLSRGATDRLWDAADGEIADFAVAELARTPIGRLRPRDRVIDRFRSMLPIFYPGYLTNLARFNRRIERSPRIAFAGDYLVGPSAELALTSGMRAATEIGRR